MHTVSTVREWMHQLHDESAKVAHWTGHLLHEKSFWGIVAILAVLAVVFTLLVLYGKQLAMQEYSAPFRYYGPF
jgi:hypothetical protein